MEKEYDFYCVNERQIDWNGDEFPTYFLTYEEADSEFVNNINHLTDREKKFKEVELQGCMFADLDGFDEFIEEYGEPNKENIENILNFSNGISGYDVIRSMQEEM